MDQKKSLCKFYFLYSKGEKTNISNNDFSTNKETVINLETIFDLNQKPVLLLSGEYEFDYSIPKNNSNENQKENINSKNQRTIILKKKFPSQTIILWSENTFLFDIKFQKYEPGKILYFIPKFFSDIEFPPESENISHRDQFNFFMKYLKDNNLNASKLKNNLFRDTSRLFEGNYDFHFYLDFFKEAFSSTYIKKILVKFDPEKAIISPNDYINPKTHGPVMKTILNKSEKIIDKVQKKELFSKKLYSFLMFYFYHYFPEYFDFMLQKKTGLCDINFINLFFENEKYFSKNDKSASIIFHYVTNCTEIKVVLNKFSTILICIISINENINLISNICVKENKIFNINEFTLLNESEKIKEILSNITKLNDFQTENKSIILKFDFNFWKTIIDNCENEIDLLDSIKYNIEKEDKSIQANINYLLLEKYHNTYQILINLNNEKNNKILEYIKKDLIFSYPKRKNNDIDKLKNMKLYLDKINLDELGSLNEKNAQDFFKELKALNLKEILPDTNYVDFINGLVNTINTFENFEMVFEFVDFKDKNFGYLNNIQKKFLELFIKSKGQNEKCFSITNKYLKEMIEIEDKNKTEKILSEIYDKIEEILNEIEKIFQPEKIEQLYIEFIKDFAYKYEILSSRLLNQLTKNLENATDEKIRILLSTIKEDNYLLNELLKNFTPLVFSEEEFYSNEDSEKLKILNSVLNSEHLNLNNFKDTEYYKGIKDVSNNIINELKESNFTFELAYTINNLGDKFKKRFELICRINNSNLNYSSIIEKIKEFIEWKEKLSEVNRFYNIFKTEEEDLTDKNKINEINQEINQKVLYQLFQFKEEIEEYIKLYDEAKKYNNLNKSKIFRVFYDYEKEIGNGDRSLSYAESEFNKLDNLFEEKNFSDIKIEYFNIILKELKSKEDVENEFKFLKKYFEKENIDTKKAEDKLLLFTKIKNILSIIINIKTLIENFNIQKTDFYNDLESKEILLSNNLEPEEINDLLEFCEKNKIDFKEEKPYLIILNQLTEKKDLILFLKDKDEEGSRNLVEFVGEDDNCSLKPSDIQDFINCIIFVNEIKKIKSKDDKDFFFKFIDLCKDNKYKNIIPQISNVNQNFIEIKDLYIKNIDKSEFTKQKVKDFLKFSQFKLIQEDGIFTYEVSYNENKKISYEEVLEVRDRALLKKDDKENNEKESFSSIAKKFSEIITKIDNLLFYTNEIFERGYPEDINYSINIVNGLVTLIEKKMNIKNKKIVNPKIEEKIKLFSNLRKIQIKKQKEKYLESFFIRFIYGKLFYIFTQFLRFTQSKTEEGILRQKIDINDYLKYITNDNYKEITFYYKKTDKSKPEDIIKDSLNNINDYLKKLFEENNITEETCFIQNKIKVQGNIGLKSFYSYKDDISENIIKIYLNLTGNPPLPQTLLICNDFTTSEEITAFTYRALLCKYNILFSILKIECLDVEKRQILYKIIYDILNEKKEINSCFVLIYENKNGDFIQEIQKMKKHQILVLNEENTHEIKLYENTVEIISSDSCGIGKSYYIKEKIKQEGKEYIYFPIGGDFSMLSIIYRLRCLNINDNCIIHVDLYDTINVDLMKDFLFSFLVNKLFYFDENMFYLGNKIKIYVEVPFGFVNFFEKFPILKLFKITQISKENMQEFKVENDLLSNIQITCNYLSMLENNTLSDNNLYIEKLSNFPDEETIKTGNVRNLIKAKILDNKTCNTLIKKYFKINNPTFYQIKCFIDIIGSQLKSFTNNYHLTVERLTEVGSLKGDKELNKMRDYILNALIENTEHFTKGAYGNLIQSQENSQKIQSNEKFNEEDILKNALEILSKREVISYQQIKPSLIFSNLDGMSLSIIQNCDIYSNEYKLLKRLYNSDQDNYTRKLIDYQKLSSEDFLPELKKVLNLQNEVDKEFEKEIEVEEMVNGEIKKVKKYEKLKSIKNIVGSYVFTADNFIKLILVLFRIEANIPVIMMGETGCGKTSLIRIMAQLMGINMKILNIHAGTNDNNY